MGIKYILPYHIGSGNRGCEGIARGISKISNVDSSNLILYASTFNEHLEDIRFNLDSIGILRCRGRAIFRCVRFILAALKKIGWMQPYLYLYSSVYLKDANPGDTLLITGGDIYCYQNGYIKPNFFVKKAKEKGLRTILYCSSFEERYLTSEVITGLRSYDNILTRESFSSNTLNQFGINNTIVTDPAFVLEAVPVELPKYFSIRPIVGLNISPYTNTSTYFAQNIINLCQYCEAHNMDVCLIPHVFWKHEDDRKAIKKLLPELGGNVHYFDTSQLSYQQIRYVISKCKYFIGGRTHSVISAYCSKVPCIALSYSVKSKGIAHDLGMPEYTVIDTLRLDNENEILNAFIRLVDDEHKIMQIYTKLDDYISHCYDAIGFLK